MHIFAEWGGLPQKCGVKERITAPMTHDHQARRRQRGTGGAGVGCVMEGKAGSSRLLWRTSDVITGVREMQFGPALSAKTPSIQRKSSLL
jgi:hypothetical protein